MESNQHPATKSSLPLFIHGDADDYGLSLPEFRTACAIARRGECFEPIPLMAKRTRMSINTLWKSIRSLLAFNVVDRVSRPGTTSLYRLNPIAKWNTPTPNETAPQNRGHLKRGGRSHPKIDGDHPPQTRGCKVSPNKVTPTKLLPIAQDLIFPPSFSSVEFRETWDQWTAYRMGLRNKPKRPGQMFSEQMRWLEKFPEQTAIEVLRQSIRNGWQGLFDPKGSTPQPKTPPAPTIAGTSKTFAK